MSDEQIESAEKALRMRRIVGNISDGYNLHMESAVKVLEDLEERGFDLSPFEPDPQARFVVRETRAQVGRIIEVIDTWAEFERPEVMSAKAWLGPEAADDEALVAALHEWADEMNQRGESESG